MTNEGIRVEGADVNIAADGVWALLRLLDRWRRPVEPSEGGFTESAWPIELRVPVRRTEPLPGGVEVGMATGMATFGFQLTLTVVDLATSLGKPLRGPLTFPRLAPKTN